MEFNEIGSLASILSLFIGLIFGFLGCKFSTRIRSGDNVISGVDNKGGNINQNKQGGK